MIGTVTRTARRPRDDAAAGVIGLVLLLALMTTYYSHAARTELPESAKDAERAWQEDLVAAAHAMAAHSAAASPATIPLPGPRVPAPVDLPLLPPLQAPPASGHVRFVPQCVLFNASHYASFILVTDLTNASRGCLELQPERSDGMTMRIVVEAGAVIQVQSDGAVVLAGPPLSLSRESGFDRFSLVLPSLLGPADGASLGLAGAILQLAPQGTAQDAPQPGGNAGNATLTLATRYPAAWKEWWNSQFAHAGFLPDEANVQCAPVDCSPGADGLGAVTIFVEGPGIELRDLSFSITHQIHRVNLR